MTRVVAICTFVLAAAFMAASAQTRTQTWTGEIMDVECAMTGSHEMMKGKFGVKDPAQCTRACMAQGGKAVLFDPATKKVYQLDNQQESKEYAGQRVEVIGNRAQNSTTIEVKAIKPASS